MTIKKHNCLLILFIFTLLLISSELKSDSYRKKNIVLDGIIETKSSEYFYAPILESRAQIKWMLKEGTAVASGNIVIRLDTSNIALEIQKIKSKLREKSEQIIQKKANIKYIKIFTKISEQIAMIQLEKAKIDASVPKGILPNFDYDKRQIEFIKMKKTLRKIKKVNSLKLKKIKTELTELELDIKIEQDKLNNKLNKLKNLTLYAKTSGVFIYSQHPYEKRKMHTGDYVFTSTLMGYIPDMNSLQIKAWVNETEILTLKKGQRVNAVLNAFPQKEFLGSITDISKNAERRRKWGKAHYFTVIIKPNNLNFKEIKPGMSIRCNVLINE